MYCEKFEKIPISIGGANDAVKNPPGPWKPGFVKKRYIAADWTIRECGAGIRNLERV